MLVSGGFQPLRFTGASKRVQPAAQPALQPRLHFQGDPPEKKPAVPKGEESAFFTPRRLILGSLGVTGPALLAASIFGDPMAIIGLPFWGLAMGQAIKDATQNDRAIPYNYPLIGHIRDSFEGMGPKLRWSLFHNDLEGRPFNRKQFELIKQRAKGETDTVAWGTQRDLQKQGTESIQHSNMAETLKDIPRVTIGGPDCKQPYSASILNISGMSFGALSPEATMINAMAARLANCYQNTGEGGIAPFHLGYEVDIEDPNFDFETILNNAAPMTEKEAAAKLKAELARQTGKPDVKLPETMTAAEVIRELKTVRQGKASLRKLLGRKLREDTMKMTRFPSGELFWNIGSGYFGCRNADGTFNEAEFTRKARLPQVKGIELKLSQGAKPGIGGKLPGDKVTPGIAKLRGIPVGVDCNSPDSHSAFSTPVEMMQFIKKLRDLSGGKPVGFKLCLGKKYEFLAFVKAMQVTGIYPDFITVDGAEGGTGASPPEFTNSVGTSLNDALVFVHNALVGAGIRDKMKIIASGGIVSGDDIIQKMARGADIVNSARAIMVAGGCIMAMHCNGPVKEKRTHKCPVGYATQDPKLRKALNPYKKALEVGNGYIPATISATMKLMGAIGVKHPSEIRPSDVEMKISADVAKPLDEVYEFIPPGCLPADAMMELSPAEYAEKTERIPDSFRKIWMMADPYSKRPRTLS